MVVSMAMGVPQQLDCLQWTLLLKWMRTGGTPILGNLHMILFEHTSGIHAFYRTYPQDPPGSSKNLGCAARPFPLLRKQGTPLASLRFGMRSVLAVDRGETVSKTVWPFGLSSRLAFHRFTDFHITGNGRRELPGIKTLVTTPERSRRGNKSQGPPEVGIWATG